MLEISFVYYTRIKTTTHNKNSFFIMVINNISTSAILSSFSPLNSDELRKMAPSIFTDGPKDNLSDRYEFVPTSDIINFMENQGWFPIDAKEVKTRKEENKGFQRHLVRFRHPELSFNEINDDSNYIDILLTNSHDGMSSFTFQIGIFRLVCSNGLIVKQADFGTVRVRHLTKDSNSETFHSQLLEAITTLVNQLPKTVEAIEIMQNTMLNSNQIKELATKAIYSRFDKKAKNIDIDYVVNQLITSDRKEDERDNVWNNYNKIQEKLLNGTYSYINKTNNKLRKARPVNNIVQATKLNAELFDMAYGYV